MSAAWWSVILQAITVFAQARHILPKGKLHAFKGIGLGTFLWELSLCQSAIAEEGPRL